MARVGIKLDDLFVGALSFSDRKKPCLVIERGNQCLVIGSFIDAKRVEYFEQALREMFGEEVDDE